MAESFTEDAHWDPDLPEIVAHIITGGDFIIQNVDRDGVKTIGIILIEPDRSSVGTALPTAEGEPMPTVGYALMAVGQMCVKRELLSAEAGDTDG